MHSESYFFHCINKNICILNPNSSQLCISNNNTNSPSTSNNSMHFLETFLHLKEILFYCFGFFTVNWTKLIYYFVPSLLCSLRGISLFCILPMNFFPKI